MPFLQTFSIICFGNRKKVHRNVILINVTFDHRPGIFLKGRICYILWYLWNKSWNCLFLTLFCLFLSFQTFFIFFLDLPRDLPSPGARTQFPGQAGCLCSEMIHVHSAKHGMCAQKTQVEQAITVHFIVNCLFKSS